MKLLGIVLIGQPELKDRLNVQLNPDAREVINRCEVAELKSLNGNLRDYLELKFKRVGAVLANVFEDDAFDAMRTRLLVRKQRRTPGQTVETVQVSMLYPLMVNNLCIKAMNQAAELGLEKVSAQLIGRL